MNTTDIEETKSKSFEDVKPINIAGDTKSEIYIC